MAVWVVRRVEVRQYGLFVDVWASWTGGADGGVGGAEVRAVRGTERWEGANRRQEERMDGCMEWWRVVEQ